MKDKQSLKKIIEGLQLVYDRFEDMSTVNIICALGGNADLLRSFINKLKKEKDAELRISMFNHFSKDSETKK